MIAFDEWYDKLDSSNVDTTAIVKQHSLKALVFTYYHAVSLLFGNACQLMVVNDRVQESLYLFAHFAILLFY
jgi:hypothetical protein